MDFCVVIPARLASSRLPEKPLLDLGGQPMIARVWANAVAAGAAETIVAADDRRICAAVEACGGRALMTSPDHASGTDRLAEVAARLGWSDDTIVVNLQGDEPLVRGEMLRALSRDLADHPRAGVATMAAPIRDAATLFTPSVVKVVVDREGYALTFSRAPIPWVRELFEPGRAYGGPLPEGIPFLRHLGLYAYRVGVLRRLSESERGAYERAESLEQLRALELGIPIHVTSLDETPPHGVDTEDDLARVRHMLRSGG